MNERQEDPIWFLRERAKELNCVYRIEEILSRTEADIGDVCMDIVRAIPAGWQYPDICRAKITLEGRIYHQPYFEETAWKQSANIYVQDVVVGEISVFYSEEMPPADDEPFLNEEERLLGTIADRLGHFIGFRKMKRVFQEIQTARTDLSGHAQSEWQIVVNLLQQMDADLYRTVSQKLLNLLLWKGNEEAEALVRDSSLGRASGEYRIDGDNWPLQKEIGSPALEEMLSFRIFEIAVQHLGEEQMLSDIQKWIQEERLSFLVEVAGQDVPIVEVKDAIRRYRHIAQDGVELPEASRRHVQVALIHRFLSSQLGFINIAKEHIGIDDFDGVLQRIISTPACHGRLGGKAAGLLLASCIVQKSPELADQGFTIRVPETWYVTSDVMLAFVRFNGLTDVTEQKYKSIDAIRLEYPRIVQTFKNCPFPPEIMHGLSTVLDTFGDKPLIVRSSSLLEDQLGAAFSGKYKSLFLANQGRKEHRLAALLDAIAEVYASVMGPDPIEYRAEKGLLDFQEQMAILIQEVVGTCVGDYFLPTLGGVALSRNDFRWSMRIRRRDGIARLVPGLGTRAVDRTADDYPVLVAPGQPGLRPSVSAAEVVRYSPTHVDLINLRKNRFETVRVDDLLKKYGDRMVGVGKVVSLYDGDSIRQPVGLEVDFAHDNLVVTFDGLIKNTPFLKQLHSILRLLEKESGTPVDIEFAYNDGHLYLLQCRPQSYTEDAAPAHIPPDLPKQQIVFTAKRHISNGIIPDITHIVYIDPQRYGELDHSALVAVGRAVGKLNKRLPKRQFILMGPGRWGSRGDIKLGVNVTYSDINNTALLVEIARKKGDYVPDLSFGTHFFQDLVEARIRYLPLYPDDDGILFNESFLRESPNLLPDILPAFEFLAETVRVIDVPSVAKGLFLQVLMNGERDEAVGVLSDTSTEIREHDISEHVEAPHTGDSWAWRLEMAEAIASQLDSERFGVHAMYVFGSTKNATTGPSSDIDLLVHFRGTAEQEERLLLWLEGWSHCLDELNYLRTGFRTGGLLDVHIITDDDFKKQNGLAGKIGAVTDPAKALRLKGS